MFGNRTLSRRFDLLEQFSRAFHAPGYDLNANVARVVIGCLLIWKLLSRNFEFYGYVPEDVFGFYPVQIYPVTSYVLWTGLPVLTDLLTFHWIHWFVDRPDPETLVWLQRLTMLLVVAFTIVGKGPKNLTLWTTYSLMVYLWGNLFLLGQEVDSIAMYFGIIIMLGISRHRDLPVWRFRTLYAMDKNEDAGRSLSLLYLVFATYYFASGLRKLTDLTPLEWFNYDLIPQMEKYWIIASQSSTAVPGVFESLFQFGNAGNFMPALVYASHLLVPIVFFKRSWVVHFFLFYAAFHLMTFGVSISFSGYIVLWGCLFHYREWIARLMEERSD